jgi:uncharacterized protein YkwD
MSFRSRLRVAVFILPLLAGCNGIDPQTPGTISDLPGGIVNSPTTSPTGPVSLDSEESAFITLINNYRVQSGFAALQVSIALTESSKWMSNDMATHNYLDHTDSLGRDPFTRMAAFGYDVETAGENIAAGNASAQNTFTQWQNSPAHNANMLDASYQVIGVGRADGASSEYGWYWTTDFGSVVDATF